MNEQMKECLDRDYYVVINLINALREELEVSDDGICLDLAFRACDVFFSTRRLVDIACYDNYSYIASDVQYAYGFVRGISYGVAALNSNLIKVAYDAVKFDGMWWVDTDEHNEYMKRLADMLYGYVADNNSFFKDLFSDANEILNGGGTIFSRRKLVGTKILEKHFDKTFIKCFDE